MGTPGLGGSSVKFASARGVGVVCIIRTSL